MKNHEYLKKEYLFKTIVSRYYLDLFIDPDQLYYYFI
jgi:hypothetical protein